MRLFSNSACCWILLIILSGSLSAQEPFVTAWNTLNPGTSDNTSITIPTKSGLSYEYDVDWDSDGVYDDFGLTEDITHDFGTPGIYSVAIRGKFPSIHFNNGGDKLKIVEIQQWGDVEWQNLNSAFEGCVNLIETASDIPDLSTVESISEMFRGCTNFTGDLSNWDVSSVPWMVSTFQGAVNFNSDISSWDIGSCNSIRFMFDGASSFNQDISNWDVSKMTTLQYTFRNATSFNQNIGDWDINQVTNMTGMFDHSGMSRKFYDRTLRGWANQDSLEVSVTLGVDGLSFCNCANVRDDLIGAPTNWTILGDQEDCIGATFVTTWNTLNPGPSNNASIFIDTEFYDDFDYDVDWDNDGIFDSIGMTGDVSHNFGAVGTYQITIRGQFSHLYFRVGTTDSKKLVSIDQWGEINWRAMFNSFYECRNMTYAATDVPDLSNVTSMRSMFSGCRIFNGDIGTWDVSNIESMRGMFEGADIFNQDLSLWDVSNVTTMESMFAGADLFNQNIGNWDISNVQSLNLMFSNAVSFNQPVGEWDVSNITSLSRIFLGAESFNQPLEEWDVCNATRMTSLFESATSFNQPIGNWNTSSVTDMQSMFEHADAFNQDITGWDVSNVTTMRSMFEQADSFDQNIGGWIITEVNILSSMLDSSNLSMENYDSLLMGWSTQLVRPNVNFGVRGLRYCAGTAARNILVEEPNNWTIIGDEFSCNTLPCIATSSNIWVSPNSGVWQTENDSWSDDIPGVCHDVITNAGIEVVVVPGLTANCNSLDVVSGGEINIELGAVLEVWAQRLD